MIGPIILVAVVVVIMAAAKYINRRIRRWLIGMDVARQSNGKAPGLSAAMIDTLYPELSDKPQVVVKRR